VLTTDLGRPSWRNRHNVRGRLPPDHGCRKTGSLITPVSLSTPVSPGVHSFKPSCPQLSDLKSPRARNLWKRWVRPTGLSTVGEHCPQPATERSLGETRARGRAPARSPVRVWTTAPRLPRRPRAGRRPSRSGSSPATTNFWLLPAARGSQGSRAAGTSRRSSVRIDSCHRLPASPAALRAHNAASGWSSEPKTHASV
jgi:hypothetical protein